MKRKDMITEQRNDKKKMKMTFSKTLLSALAALTMFTALAAQTSPAKMELQPNQRMLAYNTTDDYESEGAGFDVTGTVMPCIYITDAMTEKFVGSQIKAIRFAVTKPVGKATVFIREVKADGSFGSADLASQEIAETAEGWNLVTLDHPLTIVQGQRYFVGYKFRNTNSLFAIGVVKPYVEHSSYCYGRLSVNGIGLYIMPETTGTLCIQAIVEGDFATTDVVVSDLTCDTYTEQKGQLAYTFRAINYSSEPADIVYSVAIDDKEVTTVSGSQGLAPSASEDISGRLTLPAETEGGTHRLTVSAKTVDGSPFSGSSYSQATTTFAVLAQVFSRQKHIVEHLTSTSCTYCPWGDEMLTMLEQYNPDVARISVHATQNNNYPDPFVTDVSNTINSYLGMTGWPSASFNRYPGFLGDDGLTSTIAYYEDSRDQMAQQIGNMLNVMSSELPTVAEINLQTELDGRMAKVNVSGRLAKGYEQIIPSASLFVCVVEDQLVASQLNTGTWINDYEHNNVLRRYVSSVYGDRLSATDDDTYEKSYTFALDPEWNADNLRIVAFVAPRAGSSTMVINNGEAVSLGQSYSDISSALKAGSNMQNRVYDLQGRCVGNSLSTVSPLKPGLYIINGKKVMKTSK